MLILFNLLHSILDHPLVLSEFLNPLIVLLCQHLNLRFVHYFVFFELFKRILHAFLDLFIFLHQVCNIGTIALQFEYFLRNFKNFVTKPSL